jgi:hypothetical protein
MEEKSWKQGRVEARFEGGQGPEGAVAPYIDGWMDYKGNMLEESLQVICGNLGFHET